MRCLPELRRAAPALLLAAWVLGGAWPRAQAGAAEVPAATARVPQISVEPARFDFGRVLPQRTLHRQFSIRNFGAADLVVDRISTSCGCTAALLESRVVKPGRSTPLRVTFETRSYRGKITRSVLIRSNDPSREVLELTLEATVVPEAADPKK